MHASESLSCSKKQQQSICDGEHAGKLVAASDTQMSSISSLSPKSKKSRKSIKYNNKVFIEEKLKRQEFENCYNAALKKSIQSWTRTKETRAKKLKNKNYMGIDKTIITRLKEVNHKYLSEDSKKVTKGTLLRYYHNNQNIMLQMVPAPLLPNELFNTIRLHIKIQQLSRKS